jgi:N-acyl homoserine lactone hydrolase
MQVSGYEIEILVTGFPGKSVCNGSLGWSTIVLIRHGDRLALVDVGAFGHRGLLLAALKERGLKPSDVTDVLLTHSHYDHALNWVLFPKARTVIAAVEMEWALEVPWGETPVPELYVKELNLLPTLVRAADGDEVFPGVTMHLAPGHTPGCVAFKLSGQEHDVIFTGDAAKNRAELISRDTDMTYDPAISRASIDRIWGLWTARPGNIVVPGHDVPMDLDANGKPHYLAERKAAIMAWYGEAIDETTIINLVVE